MQTMQTKKRLSGVVAGGAVLALATAAVMAPDAAWAGTGGSELDQVWVTISDFTQGTLGRIIAGLMVIAGLGAGILRGSLGGFISGLGAGIGLYNTPTVLESIVGGALPVMPAVQAGMQAVQPALG